MERPLPAVAACRGLAEASNGTPVRIDVVEAAVRQGMPDQQRQNVGDLLQILRRSWLLGREGRACARVGPERHSATAIFSSVTSTQLAVWTPSAAASPVDCADASTRRSVRVISSRSKGLPISSIASADPTQARRAPIFVVVITKRPSCHCRRTSCRMSQLSRYGGETL